MINVTIGESKTQEVKYPKLMISDLGRIVLFTNKRSGIVMYEKEYHYGIGHLSESWNTEDFTDYNEPITLQNA